MRKENYVNTNYNRKIVASMQIINVCIGAIIALTCVVAYLTIESIYVRGTIIGAAIIFGVVCFANLYNRLHKKEKPVDESNISSIELVNEDNEIIKKWNLNDEISFIIGKSTVNNKVLVDLNSSIYSPVIDNNHAVLNYAAGKWYVEDLSSEAGVSIQKNYDGKKYRIVKDTPCELEKGDILFIYKIKLLLK